MNNSIAAIILTYNEEKHISRCINSVKNVCDEIWVIDSFSTDKTCEIATKLGAKVLPSLILLFIVAGYSQNGFGG